MDPTKSKEDKICPCCRMYCCADCEKPRCCCSQNGSVNDPGNGSANDPGNGSANDPSIGPTTDQAINDLIESTALESAAMANVLDAQGAKIQKAIEMSDTIDDLLEVNRSVNKVLANAIQLEQLFYQKLDAVSTIEEKDEEDAESVTPENPCTKPECCCKLIFCNPVCSCQCCNNCTCHTHYPKCPCRTNCLENQDQENQDQENQDQESQNQENQDIESQSIESQEPPCCPKYPCFDPKPQAFVQSCPPYTYPEQIPCMSVFCTAAGSSWTRGTAMRFGLETCRGNSITLSHKKMDSMILLPSGNQYKIEYCMELINKYNKPVVIHMRLCQGNAVLETFPLFNGTDQYKLTGSDSCIIETPSGNMACTLSIWLLSGSNLGILSGQITVTEIC